MARSQSRRSRAFSRRRLQLERLEARTTCDVQLANLAAIDMMTGKDQLIPLQGVDSGGLPISYSAEVTSAGNVVTASVVTGGRSWRLSVSGVDGTATPFSGILEFRFFEDSAPLATERFIQLTQQSPSFFNNIIFHRVIDNFIAQGGDPTGTGSGGSPLSNFVDEVNVNDTFTSRGLLAMANSGDDTNDSQFFIVDTDTSLAQMPQHLNFNHTIFGILTQGQDVLAKIMSTPTTPNPPANPANKPLTNVVINSSEVFTDTASGVLRIHAPAGFTGSANITVTATNGQSGAANSASKSVTVTVGADTWNDRPFLGPLPDRTVLEDDEITFDVLAIDLEKDAINFVVGHGDDITQLVQNVEIDGFITPATATEPTTATITFTPDPGFNGPIRIALGARDQTSRDESGELDVVFNFDTQSFTLTVIPVNDVPQFTAANPPAAAEDSGLVTVSNWASFYAGAANETSQSNTYLVTVDTNATLFSVAPAVSPSGTLTYTLAPNASGTATFSVRVKDSGGTLNGGVDTSAAQQFTLTVTPGPDAPTAVNDVALTKTNLFIPITVLANDTHDVALNLSTLAITQAPAVGAAVVNTVTGTIDYTPPTDFQGTVTIKYTVQDVSGGLSNEGTVTLRIADHPWQNAVAADINDLAGLSNLDAFLLITDLRNNLARALTIPYTGTGPLVYLDPTGDDAITNFDAFLVIGLLRTAAPDGEGEGLGVAAAPASNEELATELVTRFAESVVDQSRTAVFSEAPAAVVAFESRSAFAPLVASERAADESYSAVLASVTEEEPALLPDELAAELALALTQ